jgi:methyl-accepting chemotaxis protein
MTLNYCPSCGSKLSLSDVDANTRWITCEVCHEMIRNTSRNQNTKRMATILLLMTAFVVVVFGLIFLFFIPTTNNTQVQVQIERMQPVLKELASDQSRIFEKLVSETESLATAISALDATETEGAKQIEDLQWQFLKTQATFMHVFSAYETKHMILVPTQDLPSDYDPTGRPWYKMVKENPVSQWSTPYQDVLELNTMVVTFETPLFKDRGFQELHGVLAVDLNLTQSLKPLIDYSVATSTSHVSISIADKNGFIIYHPHSELLGQMLPSPELLDAIKRGESSIVQYQFNGTSQMAIIEMIESTDLVIIATVQP